MRPQTKNDQNAPRIKIKHVSYTLIGHITFSQVPHTVKLTFPKSINDLYCYLEASTVRRDSITTLKH